jgi:hypothetical protein
VNKYTYFSLSLLSSSLPDRTFCFTEGNFALHCGVLEAAIALSVLLLDCGIDTRRIVVSFLAMTRDFSPFQLIDTGSGAYLPVDWITAALFSGGKAAGA